MTISVPLNGNTLILIVFETEYSYAQSMLGHLGFIDGEPPVDDEWVKVCETKRIYCNDENVAKAWVRSRRDMRCIRDFKILSVAEERIQIDAVITVNY